MYPVLAGQRVDSSLFYQIGKSKPANHTSMTHQTGKQGPCLAKRRSANSALFLTGNQVHTGSQATTQFAGQTALQEHFAGSSIKDYSAAQLPFADSGNPVMSLHDSPNRQTGTMPCKEKKCQFGTIPNWQPGSSIKDYSAAQLPFADSGNPVMSLGPCLAKRRSANSALFLTGNQVHTGSQATTQSAGQTALQEHFAGESHISF
ncbi:hypothetical protein Nepgr_002577 [Nepenthes gracilis]|uniref:Uncharacterized protein n=1 Tax=Nepenthes gracilis TaxID=150966 RepID=A0AAD3RYB9_NEPGR|nr:hypothetical protein Nepgr_002577 [Nepenthes gracilis]